MAFKHVRLIDCCVIKPAKAEARKVLSPEDLVSFVPMNNLGINRKKLELVEDKALSEVSGSYTYFADDDVLLAKITPCFENGKLGIAKNLTNGVGFGSSEFIVFRSKGEIIPEYLYYFLLRPSFREVGRSIMTGAVGHKRVPKEYIENTAIPLPSKEEQKRIVAILDQAFADIDKARATAERNLKNASELFDSYLQQVFSQRGEGWTETELGKVANFKNGLNFSQTSKGEKLRIVGVKDFKSNFMVPFEQLDIIQIDGELAEGYELKENDIITVRSNGNKRLIGRCLLMGKTETKTSYSGFTIRIRLLSEVLDPEFLTYYLKSATIHELLIRAGGGANISNLNQKILTSLPIAFPKNTIQQSLLSKIKQIEVETSALIVIYEKKLVALNALKKSILQKAFTGELTKCKGIAA